jgi:hypothetical protein
VGLRELWSLQWSCNFKGKVTFWPPWMNAYQ